ncbi:metal ABC transporter permease [Planctomycetota bacterium]
MLHKMELIHDLFTHFPQAVIGGLAIAVTCSILGVFVILKRVVFIGIVLSEVAALGVAIALVFHFHPFVGASILTLASVLILAFPYNSQRIPRDAILGIMFILASSLSILLVSKSGFGLEEVKNLLYGDIIFTTSSDLGIILGVMIPILLFMICFIRPVSYSFLDRDGARVLGINVTLWELLFFFALGFCVSAASKTAGALLVFCYLVIAPSTGLLLSRKLVPAIIISVSASVCATMIGMLVALGKDIPTNQSIAVVSCAILLITAAPLVVLPLFVRLKRKSHINSQ